jgi:hypothetical protein
MEISRYGRAERGEGMEGGDSDNGDAREDERAVMP